MLQGINIRNAVLEDLPSIIQIYNSTIPSRMVTADTEPLTLEDKLSWFHTHNEKRPLWVVEKEGLIIAWISFKSFYGRPAYSATAEISLYILDGSRGAGLGKALLTYIIEKAPDLGLKTLLGFIFGHNYPSIRLFESLGFKVWGKLPGIAELDGLERDLLIYGLRIN